MIPCKIRYVAREYTRGPRSTAWGIYDRERASWPVIIGPLGGLKVPQRFDTEAEAQAWADARLNPQTASAAPPARRTVTRAKGGKAA